MSSDPYTCYEVDRQDLHTAWYFFDSDQTATTGEGTGFEARDSGGVWRTALSATYLPTDDAVECVFAQSINAGAQWRILSQPPGLTPRTLIVPVSGTMF